MPFSITPDPAYLYMSARHQEALGHLLYGTGQYGGFVQLTGEVGTGKTTIIRTLLSQKMPDVDVAMIHNPRQNETEFVQSICDELGIKYVKRGLTLKTLVDALNEHLLKAHAEKRRTVLIIDEAQQLQPDVLEQVRLLTNLETHKEKLLRIMLVGQPELADLLARPDLRQLAQRITARYHLTPLDEAETREYIAHRLRVAGCSDELFQPAAIREVHRRSRGIPRLTNVICDRALLGAYSQGVRSISAELVAQAAQEAVGDVEPLRQAPRWSRWLDRTELILAPLAIALVALLAFQTWRSTAPAPVASSVSALTADVGQSGQPLQASQPLPVVMGRLIKLWNPHFNGKDLTNICRSLRLERLECYKDNGAWDDLRARNRPAILTLQDGNGALHHALLTQLTDTAATLDTAAGAQTFALDALTPLWTGEYLMIWRRPTDESAIDLETKGEPIYWLRRRLAEVDGRKKPKLSPTFDAALQEEVTRFQAQRHLTQTGIANTATLIALGDGRKDTPLLTDARP